jgi:hypothetical protein
VEWVAKSDIVNEIANGNIHHGCVICGLLIWLNEIMLPGRD